MNKWFLWGWINIFTWYIAGIIRDFCTTVKKKNKYIEILWYLCYLGILAWYIMGLVWRFSESARMGCGDEAPADIL